jgi:hypothetical protein
MWLVAEFHKMGSIHEFYHRYRKMGSPRAGGHWEQNDGDDAQSERAPAIPLELLVKLAADASLGILHLHRENVIHRGIITRLFHLSTAHRTPSSPCPLTKLTDRSLLPLPGLHHRYCGAERAGRGIV